MAGESELTVKKDRVIIVGGGITGLTAALELGQMGKDILLLEKGPFIGGHAANLPCKATDRCLKCNDCLVEEALRQVRENNSPLEVKNYAKVTGIKKNGGNFIITVEPSWCSIDQEKCTDCGACLEACLSSGHQAITHAPSINIHPFYGIRQELCTCLSEGVSPPCISACQEGAITISDKVESFQVQGKGVLLASGFRPYEPEAPNRYGYGHLPNVITTEQADRMLRERGGIFRPSDDDVPKKVAFVQCVGSRDRRLGREYCSRVCCGYSLRMALRMIHTVPDMEITVFYMDVQNFGKDFERYYNEAKQKLRMVRCLPGDFYGWQDHKILVSYFSEVEDKTISEAFDLVILTVGLSPNEQGRALGEEIGLKVNEDGFLVAGEENLKQGVVVAGTAQGPMDVAECICDAKRAALDMKKYIEGI
ncbi:MAG: hypothetical protein DRH12_00710 [Deltaproteobacteria bacterium]|nr:MAG: hypothetical protein DRH12_00710 [Deltaproteobacteria bacterium]